LAAGAASGLGRSLAKLLAQDSTCRLILWDIDEVKLKKLIEKLPKPAQGTHSGHFVDVSDENQIKQAASRLSSSDSVKYVIGNAGVCNGKPYDKLDSEDIAATMNTNFTQHTFLLRHFAPLLSQTKRSRFVFISSCAGLFALTRLSDYVASKFALVGWSEVLRLELRKKPQPFGLTLICPFLLNTKMFSGIAVRNDVICLYSRI